MTNSIIDKPLKIVMTSAFAITIFFLTSTNIAYARAGCFGGDTSILTKEGSTPISQLQSGDRILGYNLISNRIEDEQIGDVEIIQSSDYYLINNNLKVTENHPFYIQIGNETKLVEVKNLEIGDRLLSRSGNRVIKSIYYVKKPIKVYNLIDVTPNHNFYVEGILVHNKGGHGGGGGGHSSSGNSSGRPTYRIDNPNVIYSFILALAVMIGTMTPVILFKELYNFIRFYHQKFTDNNELINFVLDINLNYSNYYSIRYSKDTEIWQRTIARSEVNELVYQHVVSKPELIERFTALFIQYQKDWTNKNFDAMIDYLEPEFYTKQFNTFQNNFGNHFDIIYSPEIIAAIPINYDIISHQHIFKIQVDAQMINFEISAEGYVISGEAEPRSFTEYWMIAIDSGENLCLIDIEQIY
jgi:Pretoxin HINT domain